MCINMQVCGEQEWLLTNSLNVLELSHVKTKYPRKISFRTCNVRAVPKVWKVTSLVDQEVNSEAFKGEVIASCENFDLNAEWEKATKLEDLLTQSGFHCPTIVGPYTSVHIPEEDPPLRSAYAKARRFLMTNSANGPTKEFVLEVIREMLEELSADKKFECLTPCATSDSVSQYGLCDNYIPGDESPFSSHFEESEHFSVPGVVVYDIFQPYFVLNVEIKKPQDDTLRARVQCLTQMLTQMHTQTVHFGIVLSAMTWNLMLVAKVNDEIIVRCLKQELYTIRSPKSNAVILNGIKSFSYDLNTSGLIRPDLSVISSKLYPRLVQKGRCKYLCN